MKENELSRPFVQPANKTTIKKNAILGILKHYLSFYEIHHHLSRYFLYFI
jgi:hypothetical protein